MEAYTDFAQVYDTFMDDTPYEEWCDYLVGLLEKYGKGTNLAEASLEVAAGDDNENNDTGVIKRNLQHFLSVVYTDHVIAPLCKKLRQCTRTAS